MMTNVSFAGVTVPLEDAQEQPASFVRTADRATPSSRLSTAQTKKNPPWIPSAGRGEYNEEEEIIVPPGLRHGSARA